MRYLSRALAVGIMATTSLPSTASAQAPGGNVAKRWRAGNALRRQLQKNPSCRRHLRSIGGLARRKKPGIALIGEMQKLVASRPRTERSRLAWSIVAEICINRGVKLCRQWDQGKQEASIEEIIPLLLKLRGLIEKVQDNKKQAQESVDRAMKQAAAMVAKVLAALDKVSKTDKELAP